MKLSRRQACGGIAVSLGIAPWIGTAWAQSPTRLEANPFTLGVASGDPDADSVVLWTRLAPKPLERGSGMPPVPVPVDWELATDEAMRAVVARGRAEATPADGHSAHVVVGGLTADRPYWYRFRTSGYESRIGRTRTLPAQTAMPERYRIAVAGCQRIEQGYFTAWDDIARADLDVVFHYGDYIYEYQLPGQIEQRMAFEVGASVRRKLTTLDEFRSRYALYKLDPDLAAAHAAHPFVTTMDDHEIVNDYGGQYGGGMPEADLMRLRSAAYQAFYENTPVRPAIRPRGSAITAYRAFAVGRLLAFAALDTRQYRSMPACGKPGWSACAARSEPDRTMIGAEQEQWLFEQFARTDATWTVLGNQVMMMQRQVRQPSPNTVHTDKWDGFAAARQRLLQGAVERKVSNLVVVTGDYHTAYAGNLKLDFDKASSPTVGVEFLASSITSDDGKTAASLKSVRDLNPHFRYSLDERGYMLCDFAKDRCRVDVRAVETVATRGARVRTAKTFEIEPGKVELA